MVVIKKFIKDFKRAQENYEEYQRQQIFWKGRYAEPTALIEFMHFDYLPKTLVKILNFISKSLNSFFNWWLDFHRISFLTLLMILAILYIVLEVI